jgi:hypothetical protein
MKPSRDPGCDAISQVVGQPVGQWFEFFALYLVQKFILDAKEC